MNDAAIAIMAMSFFGAVAITIRSIATVWTKRIDARRESLPVAALSEQMARIESAVEVMAVEIERISEAQRFSARLLAEREPPHAPPARIPEVRITTPH